MAPTGSRRPGSRGFYLTLDISVAVGLSMLIILLLVVSLVNQPRSAMIDAAGYKLAESSLYTLENAGDLDKVVQFLDNNNTNQAYKWASGAMNGLGLTMNARLVIVTYDANGALTHSFAAENGPTGNRAYAISIPFAPNKSPSKYGIATLVMGE